MDYRRFVKKIIQNKISRDNYIIISLPSTFLSLSSLIVNIDLRFVLTFSLFLKFSNNFARGITRDKGSLCIIHPLFRFIGGMFCFIFNRVHCSRVKLLNHS